MPPLTAAARAALLRDASLRTLHGAFTAVPDPRSRHGRRYELPFLLLCLTAALLANCNSLDAVGQWCADQQELLARVFGPRRHLTPTGSLFRRLLPRLSADHVEWALAAWVQATLQAPADEPLIHDGKVVRGAATATTPAPQLLSFSTAETQETVLQVRIDEKTNEIPVAQALLPFLPVAGRVILADALHTQRALAATVRRLGGDYVLVVKRNQPGLYDALADYFAAPTQPDPQDATRERRRGRDEYRHLTLSTAMNAYLGADWTEVAQVGRLVRLVGTATKTTAEIVYLITSLTPRKAEVQRMLALVRSYWRIENSRHYVRDVTFGEDRSRLRTGDAPQIMAALRNLAITLLHRAGYDGIAAARRHLAAHPARAFALLLPTPLTLT
ncbi:MAG: ISAs1 family transposase [Chloroflexota bacterium]